MSMLYGSCWREPETDFGWRLKRLGSEFGVRLRFDWCRVMHGDQRKEDVSYGVSGLRYRGVEGFQKRTLREFAQGELPVPKDCRAAVCRDRHGMKTLRFQTDVPAFDSGDYQYDTLHSLYLFHNHFRISAVYCCSGYRIGELDLFHPLREADGWLEPVLRELGFPAIGTRFSD